MLYSCVEKTLAIDRCIRLHCRLVVRMHCSSAISCALVRNVAALAFFALTAVCQVSGADRPHLIEKNGRYALQVDGMPYLILGGQIHNSSGWPSELPQVWESMAALHANTVEAPVYWEQFRASAR